MSIERKNRLRLKRHIAAEAEGDALSRKERDERPRDPWSMTNRDLAHASMKPSMAPHLPLSCCGTKGSRSPQRPPKSGAKSLLKIEPTLREAYTRNVT